MNSRFSRGAQNALTAAQAVARELGHTYIGSEHLLLGLMAEPDSAAARLLTSRGLSAASLREAVILLSGKGEKSQVTARDLTPRAKNLLETADRLCQEARSTSIGSEHLLLALLSDTDSVASRLIAGEGLSVAELKGETSALVNGGFTAHPRFSSPREKKKGEGEGVLRTYGRDLTRLAAEGRLDPLIGREEELERLEQILCRRMKNNPCLVGEPGVGKTAVVEGLAARIAAGRVPEGLRNKTLMVLDIPAMLAGAKYRGDFEERMKNVTEEVRRNPDILLFIDEIHTIIGAGAAEGAIDAAGILKPALARGEIKLIGATTFEEYRKYIEKDAALERRFQAVTVKEPSPAEALAILRGVRPAYEAHHRLTVTDEALESAVTLSVRYLSDRFLPDKAIDLIDESAASLRIAASTPPFSLSRKEEAIRRLEEEKETAIREQQFEKAAALRDRAAELLRILEEENRAWQEASAARVLTVTSECIADTVAKRTGIPVGRLDREEGLRLRQLEQELSSRVVGQKEAIDAVTRAIRRARTGLKSDRRPVGSFIFLGPTGVGKTELSKALAEALYGTASALLRFDMSEYMEKHSVSKLIGSPPGYVGYEDAGQLTERVRRQPYGVVLLDEIEKAHPDVFHLLLQILEDGRLTDARGRTVDFANTVIIMTSNAGAEIASAVRSLGFATVGAEDTGRAVKQKLKELFRPEFLNRVDEIILFRPLDRDSLSRITDLLLQELAHRLAGIGIEAVFDESLRHSLTEGEDTAAYGARPLRRAVERKIEDPLSEMLLDGRLKEGDRVIFSLEGDRLIRQEMAP